MTTTTGAEIDALKRTYDALNRNDIPAAVAAFDPEIVWIEPAGYLSGRTYRGLAAVEALFAQARGSWAEGRCEATRFIPAGDKVVVFIHVRVRLKHETAWREGEHAAVYTFRGGKAVEQRIFKDKRQALEWAGAEDEAADAG